MKLVFKKPTKSIRDLPDTELPNFVVITGVNGSGKTHLLQALSNGSITVDDLPRSEGKILSFNWTNFNAVVVEEATPDQTYKQRVQAINEVQKQVETSRRAVRDFFKNAQIRDTEHIDDGNLVFKASELEIAELLKSCKRGAISLDPNGAPKYAQRFIAHREKCENAYRDFLKRYGDLPVVLEERSQQLDIPLLLVSDEEIRNNFPLTWTPSDTLQIEFANWFSAWHAAYEYNKINRFYNKEEGESDRHFLEDDEFFKLYGKEPWKIVNSILNEAGFRHQFNSPSARIGDLDQKFSLRLEDAEDGISIKTSELSSGERILLATTLMLYQSSGSLSLSALPKLLLLDEIDAPLHPSYTRFLLDILYNKFSRELDVAIIMTTHSPSSVALAPSGSVFELVRRPRQIRKCTVQSATQLLSAGFVSVTPATVIVITESSSDPEYYYAVYNSLLAKNSINSTPPITFITATTKGDDSIGGGSQQVRNWAPKLHELGLDRFRGLIDNDGVNVSDDVVEVIDRYSVENYIFDPVTVVAYLISRGINTPLAAATTQAVGIRDFFSLDSFQLSSYIDSLSKSIESEIPGLNITSAGVRATSYIGIPEVQIPVWWLETNGHEVERILRSAVNKFSSGAGCGAVFKAGNRSELIRFQTLMYPELVSADFIRVFGRLQKPHVESDDAVPS